MVRAEASTTIKRAKTPYFKLAGPLLVAAAKRRFTNDLNNLRDLMEGDAL